MAYAHLLSPSRLTGWPARSSDRVVPASRSCNCKNATFPAGFARGHGPAQRSSKLHRTLAAQDVSARRSPPHSAQQPDQAPPQPFSWERCWYPLTGTDYLDPAKPTALTVLGHDLVVWRDAEGQWRCFRDSCPHRAAPLSEGAINPHTGHLECAYHGWQFSGSGACESIPQSLPGKPLATATASRRSCAQSFPTAESRGLLWVWLEPDRVEGAQERAAAAPLPTQSMPATDGAGREWFAISPWYVSEMEVDYVALLENSADPSHVHWTHAGFIGAPDRAGPVSVRQVQPPSTATAAAAGALYLECDDPKKQTFRELILQPPCMLWASSGGNLPGGDLALLYYVVPVAPGRCRLMSLPVATNPSFKTMAKVYHALPWLRHLYNHTVAAQDAAILHRQGTNMAAADFPGWRQAFYLPTAADGGVSALRRWLESTDGGGVAWGPNVDASAPQRQATQHREALFDHYHQHTLHCPHCRTALRRVRFAISLAGGAAVLCVLGLAHRLGQGAALANGWTLGLGAAALVALALRQGLRRLEGAFLSTTWRHADNKKLQV